MTGRRRRRPVHCEGWECDGVATWRTDWTQGGGFAKPEPGYLCDKCGWAAGADTAAELNLRYVDDGRIRGPEDVAPRIAGARARRNCDPVLRGREIPLALHELYCETAERERWVEILAADTWAEQELSRRLGRRVHRTQVRRARETLEALQYTRRIRKPRRRSNIESLKRHALTKRTKPPIVIEVLKAGKESA